MKVMCLDSGNVFKTSMNLMCHDFVHVITTSMNLMRAAFMHVSITSMNLTRNNFVCQVFFVNDKTLPGWCVVVKKEARGRRITSMDDDCGLGQEASADDLLVLTDMEVQRREREEAIGSEEEGEQHINRRRRRTASVL